MVEGERLRGLRHLKQGLSFAISQGEKARPGKKTSEFQKMGNFFSWEILLKK